MANLLPTEGSSPGPLLRDDYVLTRELCRSAGPARPRPAGDPGADPARWLQDHDRATGMSLTRADVDDLPGWRTDPDTGALHHHTGRFFSVEGVDVRIDGAAVPGWQQPIINQPEVGILGILMARVGGVMRLLLQAKNEPGNPAGAQLSPTVQATRSNYTGAHGGREVPYLDQFRLRPDARAVVDVRQSEQGSWFLHKRNRNMVVEVEPDLDVLEGFHWFTLAEVHRALTVDNIVNMDARTVLSCLPLHGYALGDTLPTDTDDFAGALARSAVGSAGSVHRTRDVLAALTQARTTADAGSRVIPLDQVRDWHRRDGRIVHAGGAFFEVVGTHVESKGREVAQWSQPMFAATADGVTCFLVASVEGVLHALVHLRIEPGFIDIAEVGPTVQCTPGNYDRLPPHARPRFLDDVLNAPPSAIRFDCTMSEEGGRFLNTCTRYLIVETDPIEEPPGFRWVSVHQLVGLLGHSHYVNVQARTLVLCLQSLIFTNDPPPARTLEESASAGRPEQGRP